MKMMEIEQKENIESDFLNKNEFRKHFEVEIQKFAEELTYISTQLPKDFNTTMEEIMEEKLSDFGFEIYISLRKHFTKQKRKREEISNNEKNETENTCSKLMKFEKNEKQNWKEDSRTFLQDGCFQFPTDIWKIIFEQISKKEGFVKLKNIRLTCRLFRNVTTSFWAQVIPISHFQTYLSTIKRCGLELKHIEIGDEKFEIFSEILPSVTSLKLKRQALRSFSFIPNSIEYVSIPKCLNLDELYLSNLPVTVKRLSLFQSGIELDMCTRFKNQNIEINFDSREDFRTPFYFFCKHGKLKEVTWLVDSGVDVNKSCGILEETPLTVACLNGHLEIVELLLKKGADINKSIRNRLTPLFIASENGYLEIVEVLLKNGADINKSDNEGSTPLSIASQNGYLEIVELLVKNGADVNNSDNDGWTSLHLASHNENLEIVKFLLKNGANVNKSNNNEDSPLFLASQEGHLEIVKLLLKNGADINQSDNYGETPLFIACENGHLEIVELLLKNGVDINKSKEGKTPSQIASEAGHSEIAELLNRHRKSKRK